MNITFAFKEGPMGGNKFQCGIFLVKLVYFKEHLIFRKKTHNVKFTDNCFVPSLGCLLLLSMSRVFVLETATELQRNL